MTTSRGRRSFYVPVVDNPPVRSNIRELTREELHSLVETGTLPQPPVSPAPQAAPPQIPRTLFEMANRGASAATLEAARRAPPPFRGGFESYGGDPIGEGLRRAMSIAVKPAQYVGATVSHAQQYPRGAFLQQETPTRKRAAELQAQGMNAIDAAIQASRETTKAPRGVIGAVEAIGDPWNLLPGVGVGGALVKPTLAPRAVSAGARLGGTAARAGVRAGREAVGSAAPVARRLATGETGALGLPKEPWQMTRETVRASDHDMMEIGKVAERLQAAPSFALLKKAVDRNRLNKDVLLKPWEYVNYAVLNAKSPAATRITELARTVLKESNIPEGRPGLYRGVRIDSHQVAVQQALSEGKPVPSEVLAEYPNLAAQATSPAPPPTPARLAAPAAALPSRVAAQAPAPPPSIRAAPPLGNTPSEILARIEDGTLEQATFARRDLASTQLLPRYRNLQAKGEIDAFASMTREHVTIRRRSPAPARAAPAAAQVPAPTPSPAAAPTAARPFPPAAPPANAVVPPAAAAGGTPPPVRPPARQPPPPGAGAPPSRGGVPGGWEAARDKLLKNIKAAKPARAETEELYSAERAQRLARYRSLRAGATTQEEALRAQGALGGTLPRAKFVLPEGLTPDEINLLHNRINEVNLRGFEPATADSALVRLLAGDIPGENELRILQKVFGADLIRAILDKRKLGQKAIDELLDAINAPRALMSSTDISAPLRQGVIVSAGHPLIASKNFVVMLKAMAKGSYAEAVQEAIQAAPLASVREEAGLYLADIVNVAQRAGTAEEAFMLSAERTFISRLLKKLPHVRLSERAYVTFLNKMRADVFDHVYSGWDASRRTPQNTRDLARFINFATGRGPLPGNEAAAILNAAFFAPRLTTSRILLPGYSIKLILTNKALRGEIARDMAAFVGTGLSVLALLKLTLGDDAVGGDPHSPDFGRIRLGPTRVDFWGGFQPIARYTVQITTGQARELPERGASHYQINRGERLLRFVRSKFAPTLSLVADVLGGRSYSGEEVEFTGGTAARLAYQNTIPLFVQDLVDAAQADGSPLGAIKAIGSAVGTGSYSVKQDAMMRYWAAVENEVPQDLKPQWDRYWELPTRDRRAYLVSIGSAGFRVGHLVAKQKYLRLQMRRTDPELDAALVEEGRVPKTEQGRRRLEDIRAEGGIRQPLQAPARILPLQASGYRSPIPLRQPTQEGVIPEISIEELRQLIGTGRR